MVSYIATVTPAKVQGEAQGQVQVQVQVQEAQAQVKIDRWRAGTLTDMQVMQVPLVLNQIGFEIIGQISQLRS